LIEFSGLVGGLQFLLRNNFWVKHNGEVVLAREIGVVKPKLRQRLEVLHQKFVQRILVVEGAQGDGRDLARRDGIERGWQGVRLLGGCNGLLVRKRLRGGWGLCERCVG
jgi:hypothetical protein